MKISNKKIFIFDLDNTICKTKKNFYSNSKPKKNIIKKINQIKKNGHTVKIFTSRYMGRNNENSINVTKKFYGKTLKQLKSWGLQFDELLMGKPSYDYFIDDKSYNISSDNAKRIIKKFSKIKKKYGK